jgi:hypothetical protein
MGKQNHQHNPELESRNGHRQEALSPEPAQVILDRLNARLDQPQAASQALDQLGRCLRIWRIRKRYSRRKLARDLAITPDQLLALETGIGQPLDFPPGQADKLAQLLTESTTDQPLACAIQHYLAELNK